MMMTALGCWMIGIGCLAQETNKETGNKIQDQQTAARLDEVV